MPDARRVAPIRGSVWRLSPFASLRFTLQQYITMCQYANKQRYGVSSLTYWHIAILTH